MPDAATVGHIDSPQPDASLEPTVTRRYVRFREGEGRAVEEPVIGEMRLAILVNGNEIVQLMCSPRRVSALVLGFLYHEGIINDVDDVLAVRVCLPDGLAEVRLAKPMPELPPRRIITSGCTGGTSFGAYLDELDAVRLPPDNARVEPSSLYASLRMLYERSDLYNRSGGVHTSILVRPGTASDGKLDVVAVGEDIGRHNTIDKLRGETLLRGVDPSGGTIVSSGRISSEMLLKAALMRTPIVGSRTSPTQLAITLAERLGLTVVGYIRSASMNVYTHPERIIGAPSA
jgi:FdhD protein